MELNDILSRVESVGVLTGYGPGKTEGAAAAAAAAAASSQSSETDSCSQPALPAEAAAAAATTFKAAAAAEPTWDSVVGKCVDALQEVVKRFPQHFKSIHLLGR